MDIAITTYTQNHKAREKEN